MTVSGTNSAMQLSSILKRVELKKADALPKDLATQSSQIKQNINLQRFATTLPGTSASALDTTGQAATKNTVTVNNAQAGSVASNTDNKTAKPDQVAQNTSSAVLSFKALKKAADKSEGAKIVSNTKESSDSKRNEAKKESRHEKSKEEIEDSLS